MRAPPDWEIWTVERPAAAGCPPTEETKAEIRTAQKQILVCNEWNEECGEEAPLCPHSHTGDHLLYIQHSQNSGVD